ncbi:MAG: hypothetical protein KJ558_06510 [Gammaproteobacteria bacterium]|nr:hypothetical protein [Gammaproteobacteria bacterium]MBU1654469.1 hypothetical protein [Gammaproteobacteria bacterium]MBU1962627.1 hypothetical protein [Gammaproteobacteria bacterium]
MVLAALAGGAVYVAWPILFPKVSHSLSPDPACDLRAGDCRLVFPSGEGVVFRILPRDIPLIEPIQIQVDLEGLQARKVMVDFAGIGMNMGFNRPELKPVGRQHDAQEGASVPGGRIPGVTFAGSTRIPVCVRKRMDWEARVMVETPEGLRVAPFRFYTLK